MSGAPNSTKFRGIAEVVKIDTTICHNLGQFLKKVYFLAFLRKAIKKDLLLEFYAIKGYIF